jgi:hypothetical protein
MKNEIIFIAEQLNCGDISEKEAIRELLVLFGVSNILRRLKNHAEIYSYPSKSFKLKLKKFISDYC